MIFKFLLHRAKLPRNFLRFSRVTRRTSKQKLRRENLSLFLRNFLGCERAFLAGACAVRTQTKVDGKVTFFEWKMLSKGVSHSPWKCSGSAGGKSKGVRVENREQEKEQTITKSKYFCNVGKLHGCMLLWRRLDACWFRCLRDFIFGVFNLCVFVKNNMRNGMENSGKHYSENNKKRIFMLNLKWNLSNFRVFGGSSSVGSHLHENFGKFSQNFHSNFHHFPRLLEIKSINSCIVTKFHKFSSDDTARPSTVFPRKTTSHKSCPSWQMIFPE